MGELILRENAEILKDATPQTVAFVSDLHFDWTEGKYCPEQAESKKKDFLKFIQSGYSNAVLCIAGDCYSNYEQTLMFIKELEQIKVVGFCVLGNHDYWNQGLKTYSEIYHIFEQETREHKYFRLLSTGRKYYLGDVCFIGDTGWTSFKREGKKVDLRKFKNLPEVDQIKDFQPREVIQKHNEWIAFANQVIETQKKVIILTHFPMTDFTEKDTDCWWSSTTNLVEADNCWKIFGHTHKEKQKRYNNVSSQRGYSNLGEEILRESEKYGYGWKCKQYDEKTMGILTLLDNCQEDKIIDINCLKDFYLPLVLQNINTDLELAKSVKKRGFKRCASNKGVFEALASDPYEYLQEVKRIMYGYIESEYIGYDYVTGLSEKIIHSIYASIEVLKKVFDANDFSRPKEFIVASLITGYVYNGMPYLLDSMRPVDDYDIIRFFLMFVTMQHFNIGICPKSIRRHTKKSILIGNLEIYLPVIDGKSLTIEEAQFYLCQTSLLETV